MATTNNGTKNELPESQIPSGYTRPNVTTFADHEYISDLSLEVDKATVDNADPAVTMANIISDAAIGLTKQIDDILAADYLGTATVTAYAVWSALTTNYGSLTPDGDYLKTALPKYVCAVRLFVKTS